MAAEEAARSADAPIVGSYISSVVRIAISPAAFEAIAATLTLSSVGFEHERNAG